jgi:hypothetical protein
MPLLRAYQATGPTIQPCRGPRPPWAFPERLIPMDPPGNRPSPSWNRAELRPSRLDCLDVEVVLEMICPARHSPKSEPASERDAGILDQQDMSQRHAARRPVRKCCRVSAHPTWIDPAGKGPQPEAMWTDHQSLSWPHAWSRSRRWSAWQWQPGTSGPSVSSGDLSLGRQLVADPTERSRPCDVPRSMDLGLARWLD